MQNNFKEKTYNIKKIYVKMASIVIILVLLILIFSNKSEKDKEHIAIIEITGIITEKNNNAKNIITSLDKGFQNINCKAIILKINSPGGTPVQSNIIHNYIKKLRNTNKKQIFSVIEDIGTSGAYLIASATEKIYCDPSSIVGSIGVILTSFGFTDAINKIGIERRIYKAGKNKAILDPFIEKNKNDEIIIQHNLEIIHENFINTVKKNRPNIQTLLYEEVFSGKFWTGKDAIELGLIDGFYDIYTLSSEIIEINTTIDYNNTNMINVFLNKFLTN
jgi:protease-4